MALLRDLFSSKRKVPRESESRDQTRSLKIAKEQVRLLLFKECDWRGRKLLFDSSTIEKVAIDKNAKSFTKLSGGEVPCIVEVSDGFAYHYKGPAADVGALGEMIFGAVAVNYKGVSLKIHILDEPPRLMCTKVFGVPALPRLRDRRGAPSEATGDASGEAGDAAPLAAPSFSVEEGVALSFSFDRADSGFYGEQSPSSSVSSTQEYCAMFDRMWEQEDACTFREPSSGRKLSACSNGSWQRRALRSLATRFELRGGNISEAPSLASADSQASASSVTCASASSLSSGGSAARRRTKLGLALLITLTDHQQMEMLRYCAEHSPQLEALICRLRMAAMLSGVQRTDGPGFVATLVRATADAVRWLTALLSGPRLRPVWLELARVPPPSSARHALAESLLADMCSVLQVGDTKHTKFFVSTLLTHVLTYHLGWVSTVSPYEAPPAGSAGPRAPYDALWAQLTDLCGGVGSPARAARTVVAGGRDAAFVGKMLTVLTYFVRCGDVTRNIYSSDAFECAPLADCSVTSVPVVEPTTVGSGKCGGSLKRTRTRGRLADLVDSSEGGSTAGGHSSLKRSPTAVVLPEVLSVGRSSFDCGRDEGTSDDATKGVVFVLGDDDKLVGLKNKSGGGRSKRSSRCTVAESEAAESAAATVGSGGGTPGGAGPSDGCERICGGSDGSARSSESPARCCSQQSQHSKPIKHSGFKFEFDKYPQIVTNYMKSKNLEILDRHYIGKPGNLKLDNFQFDPTVVPPLPEERCDRCYECRTIESTLQTPTNASELWSDMSDEGPAPQYARARVAEEEAAKSFVRKRKRNTVVINLPEPAALGIGEREAAGGRQEPPARHLRVVDVGMPRIIESRLEPPGTPAGFHCSLLGGLTDHYVPDMILQGTLAPPSAWEAEVRRDLDLTAHISKSYDNPLQAVAIIADTDQWSVKVLSSGGGGAAGGMSALVGTMLDALPHMRRARVPAQQCLSFVEWKLRELCVLSKTLADTLMSTCAPCDMASVTRALHVDADDVPLLLAVAATHTPLLARRYGVGYR